MRSGLAAWALLASVTLVSPAREASAAPAKKLAREEIVQLFAALSDAAKSASTFQGKMRRLEKSGLVLDEEPLKSEGEVWIERPDCFRQDIAKPKASVTVASKEHLWVFFPAAKEAQHIDLRRGLKGRADTTTESIMPWLTFDLAGLEKKYKVTASRTNVPEGVTLRKFPPRAEGVAPPRAEDVPARAPAECFQISFVPREAKFAPGLAVLSIWVDGADPWPLRIERETVDGDLQITEFGEIALDATVDARLFDYRPPAGTKVVELSQ